MALQGKLLIVDDDQDVLDSLKIYLSYEFEMVKTISNPNLIPETIRAASFDIVLLDMNFSAGRNTGNEGIFWLKKILKIDPSFVVVLFTAYGDVELAVKALKEGATDFILKPWDNAKLSSTLQAALKLRQSKQEIKILKKKQNLLHKDIQQHFDKLIYDSDAIDKVLKIVKKVAKTDTNVLILGENGTGKELIAHEIHKQSKRADEVFTSVDMASLSETLFESELFGHVKGAFTDAKTNRIGRFESASGGTLFLDEIGNLSVSLQSKLLTVLQNRQIVRLGSNKPIPIDIRLICATNKAIDKMVEKDLFRMDLLYRINTIKIEVPPLRQRGNDIILISEFFLKRFSTKYEKPFLRISNKAIDKLLNYHWPGNIRELKHTIEKAVILSESNILKPEDFFMNAMQIQTKKNQPLSLEEIEKEGILRALINNKRHLANTCKELKITRPTLNSKIKKYGL
jgi:DNA-binding NtrC family response regulator